MTTNNRRATGARTEHKGEVSRRRGAALADAILDAALEVLVEHGYQGFTYEAVSARAGTSRPVLYRRWPQRSDLLRAAVGRLRSSQPIVVPDTGTLRDDALGLLRNVNAARARTMSLITVQLMEYFRDTGSSYSELRESLHPAGAPTPTPFETIVARAVKRGELSKAKRSSRVINLPLEMVRYDMLMTMRAVPEASILEIVDEVWLPLLGARRTR